MQTSWRFRATRAKGIRTSSVCPFDCRFRKSLRWFCTDQRSVHLNTNYRGATVSRQVGTGGYTATCSKCATPESSDTRVLADESTWRAFEICAVGDDRMT